MKTNFSSRGIKPCLRPCIPLKYLQNTFDASASPFVNSNNIKRLDDEQRKTCEGPITEEECLPAHKQYPKNKTPRY
jgi:hypothetical protein